MTHGELFASYDGPARYGHVQRSGEILQYDHPEHRTLIF